MTSTTGTDEHPEVEEISALTEGVLPPARTADLREHLAACELCDDVRTSLTEIRDLLGTLPGPARMPADVAERIDAALAAEALLSATGPGPDPSADVSRETETAAMAPVTATAPHVSRETSRETGRESRGTGREAPDRPDGRPRVSTGPGRQRTGTAGPRARRGRRWRTALLGTACAAAVIGVGSFFLTSGSGGSHHAASPRPTGHQASGPTTLGFDELRTHVRDLLQTTKSSETAKGTETRGMKTSPETLRDSGLTAPVCVQQGIGRPESALASRQEKYNGQDAYLVVLPHPGDDTLVDAYLVSSTCEGASPSAPGKVLANRTFPRD
ncbi:anti-sigma factor family protein [Streptomyces triculaminicus]|uniref:anti-sigma factor family protein n=1 Tax=Streptomyces triculaminicus TaxID=2816232 RepID=UPI0037AC5555